MKLTVNGKIYEHSGKGTIGALLEEMKLESVQVAVMVNEEIVRREKHAEHHLVESDRVEILTFAGGG